MTKIKYFYTIVFVAFLSLSMNGMNLFVQTPNNGTISLDVEPSDSGENVKAKIFDQISVPVINQVLTWNGTTIQDNQTLADVGIVTNNSSIVLTVTTTTQVPEKMSYQAVVRNTTNNLVTNQPVGMQISILQGSSTGTAVYVETQTPTSNANGLVSLEIGGGTVVSGNMATINWANGPYFIKTETDPTGGSSYTITGTSQLLSAPYALYAKTSGSSIPGPAGPMGPQGLTGPQGPAGTPGANGQGVPVGGTTGQVLAKVDATDYNTQWVTPSTGGSGAQVALIATKTTNAQVLSLANGTNTGDLVTFDNVVTSNTTFGSYNTATNTFTVNQAGVYCIQATVRTPDAPTPSQTPNQFLFVDFDNAGITGINTMFTDYPIANPGNFPSGVKGKGFTSVMMYLTAGQTINIKGLTANSSTLSQGLSTNGTCKFMIFKM